MYQSNVVSQVVVLHSATIVFDNIDNTKQTVFSPTTASSLCLVNASMYEHVKVTIITEDFSKTGNFTVRMFPGETFDIATFNRLIKRVEAQICVEPSSTMSDENVEVKSGGIFKENGYRHLLGVRFLGERIVDNINKCN